MAVQPTTRKYGAVITTVDPTQGLVEAVMKTGETRRVSVYSPPVAFRWPVVGENWMIRQENGTWMLDGQFIDPTNTPHFHNANPGDLVLSTSTGVVRVTDDSSGNVFTIPQPHVKPSLTLHGALVIMFAGSTTSAPTVTHVTL